MTGTFLLALLGAAFLGIVTLGIAQALARWLGAFGIVLALALAGVLGAGYLAIAETQGQFREGGTARFVAATWPLAAALAVGTFFGLVAGVLDRRAARGR